MIFQISDRHIRTALAILLILLLAGGTGPVFAFSSGYTGPLNSQVSFYHDYNLSSLFPVGRKTDSGSRETGSSKALTLKECLELALMNNPDYIISQRVLRASTGDLFAAWGLSTPTMYTQFSLSETSTSLLSISPNMPPTLIGRLSKGSTATLGVSYLIFNQGEKYFGLRNAYYLRSARRSELQNSELTTTNGVRIAYLSVLRQEKLLEAAKDQAEQLKEQLRRAQKRLSVGEVTKLDVLQAQIDLQNQELLILEYENQLSSAKMGLNEVVGGVLGLDFSLADQYEIRDYQFDVEQLVGKALEEHPSLEVLRMRMKQQQGNLWMGRLAYLPTLTASAGYTRTEEGLVFTPNLQRGRQISIVARWNILDAFQRFQQNRYTQVAVDSLKYVMVKTSLQIERNVRESYLELLRLKERSINLEESKRMAAESLQLERKLYEIGSSSMVELRKAQADYLQAEVDYINSIYDYHEALSRLSLSVGQDLSME